MLSQLLVFEYGLATGSRTAPYSLNFANSPGLPVDYSVSRAPLDQKAPEKLFERCLVRGTLAGIKLIYFIRLSSKSVVIFAFYILQPLFKLLLREPACLLFHLPRCQNQSAPWIIKTSKDTYFIIISSKFIIEIEKKTFFITRSTCSILLTNQNRNRAWQYNRRILL